MDHVAILSKQLPWLERIRSGVKTIESRWYQNRSLPWRKIAIGDYVFFKNSGGQVTLRAKVARVQFFSELTSSKISNLVQIHAKQLGLKVDEVGNFIELVQNKKFAILIGLTDIVEVPAFAITKKGYGAMAAWITIANIESIMS